jgi:hypothetical protein
MNTAPDTPAATAQPATSTLEAPAAPLTPTGAFAATLAGFMARRGLDETAAAGLLGVPVFTLRKWTGGTRAPSAAAVRLLDVLGVLEALAPPVLDALTPPPTAPKRPRGRPKAKAD